MSIDLNNESSPPYEWDSVRRIETLARRSPVKFQDASLDRFSAPRSPVDRQENVSELQALRQAAYLGEQQKQRSGSIRKEALGSGDIAQPVGNFATPLSPLRARDLAALSALFLTDKMSTIEADIAQLLIRLQPEPCWEDDPFNSLQDFL